ncbi:tannase/feruloyl esterase family alpha/beta hydrolase [Variovorax humicola]
MYFTDATDLSTFQKRGGKPMVYHGGADSSVSVNDTLRWYEGVARQSGGNAQDFARMYVVPGAALRARTVRWVTSPPDCDRRARLHFDHSSLNHPKYPGKRPCPLIRLSSVRRSHSPRPQR